MPSDRSRPPDDSRDAYTGVVMQQGRVILDRDFNSVREILDWRIAREALDVVGPCGTPDDGFAIGLPLGSPPLWVPPLPLSPPGLEAHDFLIGPGTMYVGGERVVFPAREAERQIIYSYSDQPDVILRASGQPDLTLPDHLSPPLFHELVYLHLAEQEISAVEDHDLLDAALGGPDTTQRLRLLRTVRRHRVAFIDCDFAWAEAGAHWQNQQGLTFDPHSMRLLPQARLQVGFTQTRVEINLCDPVAAGGYLGAENQLIRIQIADPGILGQPSHPAQLLWGYDNASFVYRVTDIDATGKRLQLNRDPPDAFHMPQTAQAVEVLRTAAILGSEPDETDHTEKRMIVRCVAEATGFVTTLAQPYDPSVNAKALVLHDTLPADYAHDPYPLFVRIWQGLASIPSSGGTAELTDPVSRATTGLKVAVSAPASIPLTKGAFWMMGLRPSTPQGVYPERLLTSPQPPTGPRLWACPLAVIEWDAGLAHDCRQTFENLVELTKRPLSCCTVSVHPDQLNKAATLQSVIDAAARRAAQARHPVPVTICLAPGTYDLDQPLRLDAQHARMVIQSCGGAATLKGTGEKFEDGLVVLTGAAGVTLRGLTLIPQAVTVSPGLFDSLMIGLERALPQAGDAVVKLRNVLESRLRSMTIQLAIGVRPIGTTNLTLENCNVTLAGAPIGENRFGIGLFASGDCSGLVVHDCQFRADYAPTSTPGITQTDGFTTRNGFRPPDERTPDFGLQGAIGCLVSPSVKEFPNPNLDGVEPFTLPAVVKDATFSNNSFADMTLAITVMADIGSVRLHGNAMANCVAGFWIKSNEEREFRFAISGQLPMDGDSAWLRLALVNQECLLLLVLGLVYQLPQGVDSTVPPQLAGPATILIADNQIAALPIDTTRAPRGSFALAVLTGPPRGYLDFSGPLPDQLSGLVISGNRFQGRLAPQYPSVLLVYSGRCSVTGNLISAERGGNQQTATSLTIIPEGGNVRAGAPQLAVTGNVLEGASNLFELVRPGGIAPPLDTWLPFNATA
jgi:hypothetical protein